MGPDRDRTRDPWICSQIRICSQTRYRLRYAAQPIFMIVKLISAIKRVAHLSFDTLSIDMSPGLL